MCRAQEKPTEEYRTAVREYLMATEAVLDAARVADHARKRVERLAGNVPTNQPPETEEARP